MHGEFNFPGQWFDDAGGGGVALGVLDRRAEAVEAFRKVTELAPERLDALENLAGLLQSLGRVDEARALEPRIRALRSAGPPGG